MTKGTTRPFEIPKEMRAVVEQSVEQAKLAFTNYIQAGQEAVSNFERWVKASQVGISKKVMSFAEHNMLSAFEFAQKILQAKDIQELIGMQTEFVQSQIHVLTEQVKELGETATKAAEIAMESMKDLGQTATKAAEIVTKTAKKSVKDLGETATEAAMESIKDLGKTAEAA